MAASLEAQARNKSGPAPNMVTVDDVQEDCDFAAASTLVSHGCLTLSPESLQWLSECCGLRWQNMRPMDLELATSPLFLPHVQKGANPIEDATV